MVYVGSSPIGGTHITKDISTIFGVNYETAEKIKTLNSSLLISPIEEREMIKFKVTDASSEENMVRVTRQEMCEIIRLRLEELFESVKEILTQKGLPINMLNSIVLTGGVTVTVGIDKLASEVFGKNVRIGYPSKFDLAPSEMLNQNHSCSLGMLIFLQNLYLKEKIKDGFETKDSWFRRFVEKLAAI
jgi:cell division protein FtsA